MNTRWFAGIHISFDFRRIEAAMVGIHGHGDGVPIECRKTMSFDLPDDIAECFDPENVNSHTVRLVGELAEVEEEALKELIAESRISPSELLAVGVLDRGIWEFSDTGRYYYPLSNSEMLAERTGMNIVDSFSARDIACGGKGGPLLPFPAWIVLCNEKADRVLVDLGKTARLTLLPKPNHATAYDAIDYHDVVSCGELLDELTRILTRGKTTIDYGGLMTVQGKHIPELLSRCMELDSNIPQIAWSPFGLSPEPFLRLVGELSIANNWTVSDVLCTISYFIAYKIASAIEKNFPKSSTELVLSGGGCRNGLLLNQLRKHLDGWSCKQIQDCGVSVEAFDAVCVAILAFLFVDRIPAAITRITGAKEAKPLGRLTPGSPQNWKRLNGELRHENVEL